ncbi:hypothetical protein KFE25_001510 [Diacronema lutheri]|uniref:Myb-like domain-containing protein n=1 Tax=Diacronema lutheri TaxID=2081491 RepID=A0A8J5X800_DIALT|nr:hypothetical protein KFE25_001510 [Diacronema lutheri]
MSRPSDGANADDGGYLSATDAPPASDWTLASEALLLMSAASPTARPVAAAAAPAEAASRDSSHTVERQQEGKAAPRQLPMPRLTLPCADSFDLAHDYYSPHYSAAQQDAAHQLLAHAPAGQPLAERVEAAAHSLLAMPPSQHASGAWAYHSPVSPWRSHNQWSTPRAFPYPCADSHPAVRAYPVLAAADAAGSPPPTDEPSDDAEEAAAQWTAAEDLITTEAVQRFGCKWNLISSLVPGRTAASVRNRWHRIRRAARRRETESAPEGVYKCSRCGLPKKGHMCKLSAGDSSRISSARGAMDKLLGHASPAGGQAAAEPAAPELPAHDGSDLRAAFPVLGAPDSALANLG